MLCSSAEVRAETIPSLDLNVSVSLPRGGSVSTLSGTVSGNDSFNVTPTYPTTGTWKVSGFNTDSVQIGQTTSARTSYTLHTRLQYPLILPDLQHDHVYSVVLNWSNGNPAPTAPENGSVSMTGRKFTLVFSGREYVVGAGNSIIISGSAGNTAFFFVDCDWSVTTPVGTSEIDTYGLNYHFNNISISATDFGVADASVINAVNSVNQSVQQTNQLQQEANDLQEEANETGKGILGKITDFFGSFFENIINALKSLFVPEDGYFDEFFQRLNDFFAEKLGLLYTPVELFVSVLTAVNGASGSFAGIPFPGIQFQDTWLIEPQTVTFPVSDLPGLQDKLYFVTDVIMIGGVLYLLQNKMREVLRN